MRAIVTQRRHEDDPFAGFNPRRFLGAVTLVRMFDVAVRWVISISAYARADRTYGSEGSKAMRKRVSNGTCEGRKSIHLGCKEAGPRVAAIVSIVETCFESLWM
jgi:hypothetical protein